MPNAAERARVPVIDLLKALAIVTVIWIHAFADPWNLAALQPFVILVSWAVPAFFFASGYLRHTTRPVDIATLGRWLVRLLVPYSIATALALPAGLRVAVNNADAVSDSWQGAADFTVYLKLGVSEEAARRMAHAIEQREDVAHVTVIDRDAALEEFRARSGFGEALDALGENPLPHTLVVSPASGIASDVETLADAVAAMPETDVVQIDTAWVARLRAMLALADRLVDFATVLLGLAVAIVIGNTIRLEINNRSVEIEVTKLVGGTDAFIRRPFLYLGLCYGVAGALLALAVVALGLALSGSFVFLAAVSAVARLVMYLAVCLSTLVLRRRTPNEEMGPALFTIPLGPVVPLLATAVAAGILFGATAQQLAAGGAALVAGAVLYAVARRRN